MPRLFFAMPIESDDMSQLIEIQTYLSEYKEHLNIVPVKNYHITMGFLGDCTDAKSDEILKNISSIKIPDANIPFSITGLGAFPALNKANTLWAGIKTDMNIINELQDNVKIFSSNMGLTIEKKEFIPHLTLARVKRKKNPDNSLIKFFEKNKETPYVESFLTRFVLYSSKLTPDGPIYTEIKSREFES